MGATAELRHRDEASLRPSLPVRDKRNRPGLGLCAVGKRCCSGGSEHQGRGAAVGHRWNRLSIPIGVHALHPWTRVS